MSFTIDAEFRDLLPPHTPEEAKRLKAKLQREGGGIVTIWLELGTVIDGHHTLRYCQELSLDYQVKSLSFKSREEVIAWMIDNQLARRNLTDEQRAYFIGRKYLEKRKNPGNPQLGHIDQVDPEPAGETRQQVAKETGIAPSTVQRNARFAEAVDKLEAKQPGVKDKILSGQGPSKTTVIEAAAGELLLCRRCERVAPGIGVPGCGGCKQMRDEAARKAPGTKAKAELVFEPVVDAEEADEIDGLIERLGGAFKAYAKANGQGRHGDCQATLTTLRHYWAAWQAGKEGPVKAQFVPPTVEEVRAYCQEAKIDVDPQYFVDFYASKDWLVGKAKMKDWKAAARNARTWQQKGHVNGKAGPSHKGLQAFVEAGNES